MQTSVGTTAAGLFSFTFDFESKSEAVAFLRSFVTTRRPRTRRPATPWTDDGIR